MPTLTETIREQLRARNLSIRKIHLATGLQRITVKTFLDGKEVHSSTLDEIAEFLGAEVNFKTPDKQPKPKRRTS